jgi:hypothetical protein
VTQTKEIENIFISVGDTPTDRIIKQTLFEGQGQYKSLTFFPFYAYTLRFLVPRRCRVTLQPGLSSQDSISFVGLQGAPTLVPKPSSGSLRFFLSEL